MRSSSSSCSISPEGKLRQGIVKHPFNEKLLLATRKFEETLARFELIFTLITCITYGQNCISPGKL
ncbi:hypothetical protein YC2023_054210 [Brassica napus]